MPNDIMYCTKCGKAATKDVKQCTKCGNRTFVNIRPRGAPVQEPDDETLAGAWKKHLPGANF
jgi:DNA-directed RNA polymerase subunit RPC12/RpoP